MSGAFLGMEEGEQKSLFLWNWSSVRHNSNIFKYVSPCREKYNQKEEEEILRQGCSILVCIDREDLLIKWDFSESLEEIREPIQLIAGSSHRENTQRVQMTWDKKSKEGSVVAVK